MDVYSIMDVYGMDVYGVDVYCMDAGSHGTICPRSSPRPKACLPSKLRCAAALVVHTLRSGAAGSIYVNGS